MFALGQNGKMIEVLEQISVTMELERQAKETERAELRAFQLHLMQQAEKQTKIQLLQLEESRLTREAMERNTQAIEKGTRSTLRLEEASRVSFDRLEDGVRGIEHMTDWMLDYHQDENERFHTLKTILPGLLKDGESSATRSSSRSGSSGLGEDRVVEEGDSCAGWGQQREEQQTSWDQPVVQDDG